MTHREQSEKLYHRHADALQAIEGLAPESLRDALAAAADDWYATQRAELDAADEDREGYYSEDRPF